MSRIFPLLVVFMLAACQPFEDLQLTLEGTAKQGGLMVGTTSPGAQVTLNGAPVRVYADGRFLIGFGRDAAAQQVVQVRGRLGSEISRTLTVEQRSYAVQNIRNVDQSRVSPPASLQARLAEEAAQTRAARNVQTPDPFFTAGWVWPVTGPITGVYGSARIYNGTPGAPHWGIDIAAATGTPVLAPSSGVVRLVHQDNWFAGGLVILDHGYGLTSSFLHLSRIDVVEGQIVPKGAPLGAVGSTGRSTGPHLDWRMNLGSDTRLDVALLPLPSMP